MSLLPEEFYPTPPAVIKMMLDHIDLAMVDSILEPSAGTGSLIDGIKNSCSYHVFDNIDVCEIEKSMHPTLKSKGCYIVGTDFLQYRTFKQYSLILMNPPFSNGDKHLLHAIKLMENGGQICCLLNAETLKNPFSNTRKDLVNKLNELNADIEYVQGAFEHAERPTDVEIAIVYIDIPVKYGDSDILSKLKAAEEIAEFEAPEETQLTTGIEEFVKVIVNQYDFEIKAGITLIKEYQSASRAFLQSFSEDSSPILQLSVSGKAKNKGSIVNHFIEEVRSKYWTALFTSKEFQEALTSTLLNEYRSKIEDLRHYDFTLSNIYQIKVDISQRMVSSVEAEILKLFDDFTVKHSYWPECSNNVTHYYNGWTTNKCAIINKKVIVPLQSYDIWGYHPTDFYTERYIQDIEKVFNYLDGGKTSDYPSVHSILTEAEKTKTTKNIEFKYFTVAFYQKGTCHIRFKDLELLKKMNIFAGKKKGGLPPSYGKKSYTEMNEKEKAIIDDFEGQDEYNKVFSNADYFISDISQMLMLASNE